MSGEVFAVKCCKREWVPAGRGLAGLVEGRQHLKGARANANFKINWRSERSCYYIVTIYREYRELPIIVFSVWLCIFTHVFHNTVYARNIDNTSNFKFFRKSVSAF